MKRITISRVAVKTISKGFRFYFAKKAYHETLEKSDPTFRSSFLDYFRKEQTPRLTGIHRSSHFAVDNKVSLTPNLRARLRATNDLE